MPASSGRMKVDRRHLHPMGYVHGGAWVAFADTVAAWGTMRNLRGGPRLHDRRAEDQRDRLGRRRRRADGHRRTAARRLAHTGLAGPGDARRAARRELHLHPDDPLSLAQRSSSDGHRGVAPGNPADAPAAPRPGAAEQDPRLVGLDPPAADLLLALGERPAQVAVEDVPARHPQLRARGRAGCAPRCRAARRASRSRQSAIGSARTLSSEAQRRLQRRRAGALGVGR